MKKSRVVLAVVLAIVFVIVCVNAPTFSWFTRPNSQSGGQALFGGSNGTYSIYAYNGNNVSIVTKSSTTGVAEPDSYTTTVSDSAGLSENGNNGINPFNRKYFCTTITNSSGAAQNVSLYARTLSIPTSNSNGTLAIGVNGPTRSYHDYSSLAKPISYSDRDSMRIYFQKPTSAPDGWAGTEFYICWNEDPNTNAEILDGLGTNGTYYKLTYCGSSSGYYNYYADIPKTATHAFFAVENFGTNGVNGTPNYKQRTQTLWNLAGDGQTPMQSKVYKLTYTVSGGNTTVTPHSVNGACINHYYKDVFVATGNNNTFDARLSYTTNIPTRPDYSANYIGTLKYYSGNTNIFTVGENTGIITPVGSGTATLYTKAVGTSYSDSQQVETTVHVTDDAYYVFNDVPIVKNIQIPVDDQNTDSSENVVKVYWYVINNSKDHALRYTIDQVYLGL